MPPFALKVPLQSRLTDEVFDAVLHKATMMSRQSQLFVVDLSGNNLRFSHLLKLTKHFEKTKTRVFALDMAQNRVETDWEDLSQIVDKLLGQELVWYIDLGMNYLPPICSLAQAPGVRRNLLQYEDRLSLGLHCNHFTGEAEVDMWTKNARVFKNKAYGTTQFAEDSEEE